MMKLITSIFLTVALGVSAPSGGGYNNAPEAHSFLPKSARTQGGPAKDGLLLAIVAPPTGSGIQAELRNVGSATKTVFTPTWETEYRPMVTDQQTGRSVPISRYVRYETGHSHSVFPVPIPPGRSIFFPLPLDAYVELPPGHYVVRYKAVQVLETETHKRPALVSNAVTVNIL